VRSEEEEEEEDSRASSSASSEKLTGRRKQQGECSVAGGGYRYADRPVSTYTADGRHSHGPDEYHGDDEDASAVPLTSTHPRSGLAPGDSPLTRPFQADTL
jgi:hypothetical protein